MSLVRWLRSVVAHLRGLVGWYVYRLAVAGAQADRERFFGACAMLAPSARVYAESSLRNLARDRSRVRIGANTHVRGELLVFAHGGNIVIGEDCYIGDGSRIWSADRITIGNRVLIAHNVNIHDNNSHPTDPEKRHRHFLAIVQTGHPSAGDLDIQAAPVTVGDDVWIGFNATILKGVTIGPRAIIGAGAVVTRDVPPAAVVVGNPCKVIKTV